MLAVTAFVRVDPAAVPEFEVLAAALWQQSHAAEPGLRRYEYVRRGDPGSYLVLMLFDDHDAFIIHQASDHHAQLAGRMRDLIVSIDVELGEPVVAAFGSPDQLGQSETAPVIDPVRRAEYAMRYPLPPATWWRGQA
jgi:quinol monooxygenase YgiN